MILDIPDKKYLYYLIVSQLQQDGYQEQALQLEEATLQSVGVVRPSDKLGKLFSSCLVSVNEVTNFFSGREFCSSDSEEGRSPEKLELSPNASVSSAGADFCTLPASSIVDSSVPPPSEAETTLQKQRKHIEETHHQQQQQALQESIQSCVDLLSNDTTSPQNGEALSKDSISEVFQLINNLSKLNQGLPGKDEQNENPLGAAGDAAQLLSNENLGKALETLQQTLNGVGELDESSLLPNSLTGAASMLGLTDGLDLSEAEYGHGADLSIMSDPGMQDYGSVKPFSLADKQLKCDKCDYLTFSKRAFTLHLRSHEETPVRKGDRISFTKHNYSGNKLVIRPYACKMCKYRAPSRIQLTLHVRTHTGEKPHSCPYCDYRTAQKGNLKKHIEFRHAKTQDDIHICNLCDFKTSSKMQLSLHISQNHIKSENTIKSEENGGSATEERYNCNECDFKCVWVGSLRSHMFDNHPEMMDRSRSDPPEHRCPMCEYSSQWRGNLKTHMMRKHSEPMPVDGYFHCKRCDYKSRSQEELGCHYDVHVSDERPYQCRLCDYRAGLKNTLDTHMKYKHSDEKPFNCEVCSYRCVTKGQLTIHQRKHTGERPYKCPYCSYDTAQQSNLKSHVKHRHPHQNQHIFNSRRGRKRKYPLPYEMENELYNPVSMAFAAPYSTANNNISLNNISLNNSLTSSFDGSMNSALNSTINSALNSTLNTSLALDMPSNFKMEVSHNSSFGLEASDIVREGETSAQSTASTSQNIQNMDVMVPTLTLKTENPV